MKILSSLYQVRTQHTLFDTMVFKGRYHEDPFELGDSYLMLLYQRVHYLTVQLMDNITHKKCDTEGFVPIVSLNGVVSFPYLFIRFLIGSTGKI